MKPLLASLVLAAACVSAGPVEVVQLPPQPPPGPWLVLRDTLSWCSHEHGVAGEFTVRLGFDLDGGIGSVATPYGDAFEVCIGRSLQRVRYRGYAGRRIDVPFVAPAG